MFETIMQSNEIIIAFVDHLIDIDYKQSPKPLSITRYPEYSNALTFILYVESKEFEIKENNKNL